MKQSFLVLKACGHTIGKDDEDDLETNEQPLYPAGMKVDEIDEDERDRKLQKLQSYADEHGILLPTHLNRPLKASGGKQLPNEVKGERPLIPNTKY